MYHMVWEVGIDESALTTRGMIPSVLLFTFLCENWEFFLHTSPLLQVQGLSDYLYYINFGYFFAILLLFLSILVIQVGHNSVIKLHLYTSPSEVSEAVQGRYVSKVFFFFTFVANLFLIYHTIWSVPITFAMPYKEGFDATNYGVFCFYLFCLYNCCLSIIRAKEPSIFFLSCLWMFKQNHVGPHTFVRGCIHVLQVSLPLVDFKCFINIWCTLPKQMKSPLRLWPICRASAFCYSHSLLF
jgi:hypothetical protein